MLTFNVQFHSPKSSSFAETSIDKRWRYKSINYFTMQSRLVLSIAFLLISARAMPVKGPAIMTEHDSLANESSTFSQVINGTPTSLAPSSLSASGYAKESQALSSSSDKPLPSSNTATTPNSGDGQSAGPLSGGVLGDLGLNVDIDDGRGNSHNLCQEAKSGVCPQGGKGQNH